MCQLTGDAKYIDVLERSLYNGALDGLSLSGDRFFYDNPLASNGQHQRREWFGTACCPANIARLVTSVGNYIYGKSNDGIWVNLFVGSNAKINLGNNEVNVKMETNYPWDGKVKLNIDPVKKEKFRIYIREPEWATNKYSQGELYQPINGHDNGMIYYVNGKPVNVERQNGFVIIDGEWKKGDVINFEFKMEVKTFRSKTDVKQDDDRIAVQRGPILYCVEGADNKEGVWNLITQPDAQFTATSYKILDEPVVALQTELNSVAPNKDGTNIEIKKRKVTAIPYYCWANRGHNSMQVWLPTKINDIKVNYQSKYPDGGNYQP